MATTKNRHSRGKFGRNTATRPLPLVRHSKLAKWGNSLAFRIPQELADHLHLRDGGQVSLEVRSGTITVRPVRKKWTEDELLQGVTPDMVGGELDWGGAVGKEV